MVIIEAKHFKYFYAVFFLFWISYSYHLLIFNNILFFLYIYKSFCNNLNSLSVTCCKYFCQVNICLQCLLMSFISRSNFPFINYISIFTLSNFIHRKVFHINQDISIHLHIFVILLLLEHFICKIHLKCWHAYEVTIEFYILF